MIILSQETSRVILPKKIDTFRTMPLELSAYLLENKFQSGELEFKGKIIGPIPNQLHKGCYSTLIKKGEKSKVGIYAYNTNGNLFFQLYSFILEIEKESGNFELTRSKGLLKHLIHPFMFSKLNTEINNEWFYRKSEF